MVNRTGMSQRTTPLSGKRDSLLLKTERVDEVAKGSPKKTEPA